jgi:hypothetical protein
MRFERCKRNQHYASSPRLVMKIQHFWFCARSIIGHALGMKNDIAVDQQPDDSDCGCSNNLKHIVLFVYPAKNQRFITNAPFGDKCSST